MTVNASLLRVHRGHRTDSIMRGLFVALASRNINGRDQSPTQIRGFPDHDEEKPGEKNLWNWYNILRWKIQFIGKMGKGVFYVETDNVSIILIVYDLYNFLCKISDVED